ncbi:MAG: hypothetical protein HRT53_08270 [Colwellia sp.]|nr:hypothetical protein [Colwellia sp.]
MDSKPVKNVDVISAVKDPLGLLVLVVLVAEVILGLLAAKAKGIDFTLLIVGMLLVLGAVLFIVYKKYQGLQLEDASRVETVEESQKFIVHEEARWESDLSQANTIFSGIVTMDMTKVKNSGTTREIDEILDSRITKNPEAAKNLVKLFNEASDDSKGSQTDLENKKLAREFLACYFVTSGASTVRALLLESDFRNQLFKSAQEDNNVYVKTQLVRALANTIEKSNEKACIEFVNAFITKDNVLVSGYAYLFSQECGHDALRDQQSAWEKTYQGTKQSSFYAYLADDNKRLRYVATGLAGYVKDETSLEFLRDNTRHEYDQVRIFARKALALRAYTDTTKGRE